VAEGHERRIVALLRAILLSCYAPPILAIGRLRLVRIGLLLSFHAFVLVYTLGSGRSHFERCQGGVIRVNSRLILLLQKYTFSSRGKVCAFIICRRLPVLLDFLNHALDFTRLESYRFL
jgi:hypothetical protein